jgi:hypothetical protein
MLWRGEGGPADKKASVEMAFKAAEAGVPIAHIWLAQNLEGARDNASLGQAMFHYAIAAEIYERRKDNLRSKIQHKNRGRLATRLPDDIVSDWFEKALSWGVGDKLPIEPTAFVASRGPDDMKPSKKFEQPRLEDRQLDGCVKSSQSSGRALPEKNSDAG